ncbi:FBP26 Fructose-2 [Candida maltosa Xu316]|uniref:fructose-2,6-bisphosphate 2-phosphatase n=1 Tax=Candida maltosa (strain Xu316) TaxID=1245528 RepID=M3HL71_CANMX|nr:hypothetical protein G210_1362 [Candida maltosa Xu316]
MERICVIIDGNAYVSQKLTRYLSWLSVESKYFKNSGDTKATLSEIVKWFDENEGVVAILDTEEPTYDHKSILVDNGIDSFYIGDGSTVFKDHTSFIKFNENNITINQINSHLQSRISYFTLNLKPKPRTIYLSRHGESMFNVTGQLGGDSDLSPRGFAYAKKLPELIKADTDAELTVWISTLKRTSQTASYLTFQKLEWKALDELDAGQCDGLTYQQVEEQFPEDFRARDENKFEYRYRGGESYRDIIIRLEPIIMELERQENILIITHQAVLRCLYAYFMNVPQEESPWMSIPLHTLIKLEPGAFETKVTKIKANIPAVSTYKEKGTSQLGESATSTSSKSRDLINNV